MLFSKKGSNDPLKAFQSALHGLLLDIEERKVKSPIEAKRRFLEMRKVLMSHPRFAKPKDEDDAHLIERINSISQNYHDGVITDIGELMVQLKHLFNYCDKVLRKSA